MSNSSTNNGSLSNVCKAISSHFNLDYAEVLTVAAEHVPLTNTTNTGTGGAAALPRSESNGKLVDLAEYVPPGKNLAAMTLVELAEAINQQEATDENVIPFLLRLVAGEFHYGQGLKEEDLAAGDAPTLVKNDPSVEEHKNAVAEAFDVLAAEARSKNQHLHQIAGWVDLSDKQIWDSYVQDTIQDKIKQGDSVFEAGCGVLAFLQAVRDYVGPIMLGGVDGAERTIKLVQNELAPEYAENFSVGMIPESLEIIPSCSWDVVCCNSVFQYLIDREVAKQTVIGMIRVAKKWVIIADVCDDMGNATTQSLQKNQSWSSTLPEYRTYPKTWWFNNFTSPDLLISIRHVETPTYKRRRERYVVYIEKLDAVVNES